MPAEMTLWSYMMQWLGYLGWCASASDPACRPFVGFLALFGASAGTLSILVLGLVRMLNRWELDIITARASAADRQRELAVRAKLRRAEPALGLGAAGAYVGHAEPLMPAAGALAMTAEPLRTAQPVAIALRRTQ